ncbi:MAG: hypothetical protein E6J47_01975 [Chloroflexi bacterium]|nr:MAG: hypothetical protein E6J47_01975 [Chloroflexota bacterium]
MSTPHRAAWLTLGIGLLLMLAVQLSGHRAPAALYDGVVIEDPYRYLQPPPGAAGNPSSATASAQVESGSVGQLYTATTEVPPQAQVIAEPGALMLPAGATSVTLSVTPAASTALPTSGRLAGNAYRISVTDQTGAAVTIRPGSLVTLVLRADRPPGSGTIAQFVGGAWETLPSDIGGLPDLFSTNMTSFGDFGVVDAAPAASASAGATAAPSSAPSTGGESQPPWILIILIAVAAAVVGWVWGDAWDSQRRK